jgi:hypothetical protein
VDRPASPRLRRAVHVFPRSRTDPEPLARLSPADLPGARPASFESAVVLTELGESVAGAAASATGEGRPPERLGRERRSVDAGAGRDEAGDDAERLARARRWGTSVMGRSPVIAGLDQGPVRRSTAERARSTSAAA